MPDPGLTAEDLQQIRQARRTAQYEKHKRRAADRQAEQSHTGRDIGPIPPIRNPERRAACERDFERHCLEYHPATFFRPFCDDHRRVIRLIEQVTLSGGLFAMALPRGFGKSSLCQTGAEWAALHGHHAFIALIGSALEAATELLDGIKTELESNPLLLEDFPEICYPIHCLEGIANRANGQICEGARTRISWRDSVIVLPTIRGSRASGTILKAAGLLGRIRGMAHKRADGRTARPSLVIVDDPQTDESARSLGQCQERERVISSAVLYMNGPGEKITGYMPCTVIRKGDVADNILDRSKNPEWHGVRTRMIYDWPRDMKRWEQYAELRRQDLQNEGRTKLATEYYVENREAMDAGARLAWPDLRASDCVSALQHAMNLHYRNPQAFAAECQNDPQDEVMIEEQLTAEQVRARGNGLTHRAVPLYGTRLTAYIDVQEKVLPWLVAAWGNDFTGAVIDYGFWPEQPRRQMTRREMVRTIRRAMPGAGFEGALYSALQSLVTRLLAHDFHREDGATLRIERLIVDANWGKSTEVVYQFCRESQWSAILMPGHGRYIGASSVGLTDKAPQHGDRRGLNWTIPARGNRGRRHIVYDTNYWKSYVHARLATAKGDPGALTLWGRAPDEHRMFAEHVTAEYYVRTEGMGRTVDEWKLRPEKPDNDFLDCLVGAAVAASEQGCTLAGMAPPPQRPKRRKVRFSELQKRRKAVHA